jgi:hypothetical protein
MSRNIRLSAFKAACMIAVNAEDGHMRSGAMYNLTSNQHAKCSGPLTAYKDLVN